MTEAEIAVGTVLIHDDSGDERRRLQAWLNRVGLPCIDVKAVARLPEICGTRQPRAAVLGIDNCCDHAPQLVAAILRRNPDLQVVILCDAQNEESGSACLECGAASLVLRPLTAPRLEQIGKLLGCTGSSRGAGLRHPEVFADIVTANTGMCDLFRQAEAVARSPAPVLITGETGVGKELLARAVHRLSNLPGKFVPVNVAGVDDQLFADTVFGHVKGAYTGAISERQGAAQRADGGTLFLDEIGDLPTVSQMKLLRFIQERRIQPLGSDGERSCNVRIIAATHRDLAARVRNERFRPDLYFRLHTHLLHLPPLRERMDDLPLLVDHFVRQSCEVLDKPRPRITDSLLDELTHCDWPGNVRQLEAAILDAVSRTAGTTLTVAHLNRLFRRHTSCGSESGCGSNGCVFTDKLPTLAEVAAALIEEAMRRADDNQTTAAEMLGISQPALSRRLKKLRYN